MCSSFVRIFEGRFAYAVTHHATRCHFEVFSQSVSQLFHGRPPAYRPRAASLTSSASLPRPAGCSRPLPGSNTSSNASTRLLAPGGDSIISLVRSFSPLGSLPACRVIPVALCPSTAVGWDCVRQLGVVGAGAWRGLGHGLGGSASSPIIIHRLPFVSPLLPMPV